MATITLDHPITIAGVVIHSVPIRRATPADIPQARRIWQRTPDAATMALVRAISPRMKPGEDAAEAVVAFDLIRRATGLPFATLVQIDERDQQKLSDFLFSDARV